MPKPVIFIPGFPASELHDGNNIVFPPSPAALLDKVRKQAFFDAMLDIPGRLTAGPPIRSVLGIAKQADTLYELLASRGYTIAAQGASVDFAPVGWDWRLGVDAKPTMDAIANAIRGFAPRKVVPIIHSTGALVFRAFLAKHPELINSIEQVISFGGAWCGTLEALFAVHVGHSEGFLGITFLTEDEGANLIGHAQAAYDLFPPDPARTDMGDVQLVHGADGKAAGAAVDLSWIKAGREGYATPLANAANARLGARSRDFGSLPLTNVVGWGGPTWPSAILTPHDVTFLAQNKEFGDSTVPFASASWIQGANVRTIEIPIGSFVTNQIPEYHAHLWESAAVKQIFDEVLGDTARGPVIAIATDNDNTLDMNALVTFRITAQSADGKPLPNLVATAKIPPKQIPLPFNGGKRQRLDLKRNDIHANTQGGFFRFLIDFKWDGGSRLNVPATFRAR
jgi:pimeloyl-ACP methyl ester carboxylesterase